jgi:hypothetical protein
LASLVSFGKVFQVMFGKSQTRLTRGLLLVAYLLATSTAVLFHDHSGPCEHDHAIGHAHCGGCDCDHLATTATDHDEEAAHNAPLPCPDPLADDDCAVCRFLGLCSLPVAPPAVLASGDLPIVANPSEPIHEARPLDRTLHSRAPPRLG